MNESFISRIHNIINDFQRNHTPNPRTIHLGPEDSVEFCKQADKFFPSKNDGLADKVKEDFLMFQKFPEELNVFGIKLLFSQSNKTVIY